MATLLVSHSMTFTNPSLQVTKNHTLELNETAVNRPQPGQVLLHVRATGICGSDIHFWKTGAIGELKVLGNCTLGHEAAGEVIEVGENVTNVAAGDRVAIEPGVPCGNCFLCSQGDYNLCEQVQFIGVYPYHGSMQRFLVHDARYVHKLPDNMSYEKGALVEPASVAYHAIERAQLRLGGGVLVAGAGPIGLFTLLLAKASGCTPLCITDISQDRLDFAKKLVPELKTYRINPKLTPQETGLEIKKQFGPTEYHAPHVCLECTGVESSINCCAYATRRSGTLMVVGVGKDEIKIPFMTLSLAEVDVKFINRYHHSWAPVIKLISEGIIKVEPLVTHRFPLEQAKAALECSQDPTSGSIKVMIVDTE